MTGRDYDDDDPSAMRLENFIYRFDRLVSATPHAAIIMTSREADGEGVVCLYTPAAGRRVEHTHDWLTWHLFRLSWSATATLSRWLAGRR